jgi:hypothetical protein
MPTISGELKQLAHPTGGGFVTTRSDYTDGTSTYSSFKNRMVFPLIRIDDTSMEGLFVANEQLGREIDDNLSVGEQVCLVTYGHLLRKKVIIAARNGHGEWFRMPAKGYFAGMVFYTVFSPMIVLIPAAIVGMLVGSVGGRQGTALGLLLGILYAVGIAWYSAYRFRNAYMEMKSLIRETSHGEALRTA